jgi:hypothetical protein
MAAHERPLLGVEGTRLVQDAFGEAELADVMQLGRLPGLDALLGRQAEPVGDSIDQTGDGGVALGQLRIAFLQGPQQDVAALAVGERRPLVFWAYMRWSTSCMAWVTSWLSSGSRIAP